MCLILFNDENYILLDKIIKMNIILTEQKTTHTFKPKYLYPQND